MDLAKIIVNMAQRDEISRQARREKLANSILKCPKCRCTDILVYEMVQAVSEHRIIDGVWKHEYDNNEYGDGLGNECECSKCGYRWKSRRGDNFDAYYISEN